MNDDTLFDRAAANYNAAKAIRDIPDRDELYLNLAGYHLQQAVELTIKYLLENEGVEYPYTHDIDQLIRLANENHVELFTGGYIDEHSEMLSQWEAKTRYIRGYFVEERKINTAMAEIRKYLECVKEHIREERSQAEHNTHDEI